MKAKMTAAEWYEAIKNNKLMGVKCGKCGEVNCPPRMVCQECGSPEGELVELSKKGILKTFTVSNVAAPSFRTPYVVAMVETEEGPWLMGNIVTIPPDKMTEDLLGKPVTIGCMEVEGDSYSGGKGVSLVFMPQE